MIAPVFPADASFLPRRHAMAPWNPKKPTVEVEMKIRYIEKNGLFGETIICFWLFVVTPVIVGRDFGE